MKQGFLLPGGFGDTSQADLAASVVGSTISALCSVDSRAKAFIGDNGSALSTPLADGRGTMVGRRFSKCFRVTQRA